eukprot:CAMPEP_0201603134 /NCGR_PEP_ID=MMETSP0492-20130828/3669_1 /ASSEMBLY_ACC=CAM_ASM_000837 /TAXON_ID=420259 /ORGANISM="Thalassiosira gravida, Strain GMp14c1" /LENGTH=174 /DNA_ID=CAMNT_0048066845 /DNA_START=92 /DNA_END=616 /DNA_ORIENTATION=+
MKAYSISYVSCDGNACDMRTIEIPFDPPLHSAREVKSRLVEDHHRAFAPKFSWLVTDPMMRMLFGACILLGVGTVLGREELSKRVDDVPWADAIVTAVFGTSARFSNVVVGAWYFSLFAHTAEACYTAYFCKVSLKMKTGTIIKWALLNVCTGFPIMNKVTELVAIDRAGRLKK